MQRSQQKSPSNLELLTPEQVAVIAQVKVITVRLWLRRGLIPGVKIGHTWRISKEALKSFIDKTD